MSLGSKKYSLNRNSSVDSDQAWAIIFSRHRYNYLQSGDSHVDGDSNKWSNTVRSCSSHRFSPIINNSFTALGLEHGRTTILCNRINLLAEPWIERKIDNHIIERDVSDVLCICYFFFFIKKNEIIQKQNETNFVRICWFNEKFIIYSKWWMREEESH